MLPKGLTQTNASAGETGPLKPWKADPIRCPLRKKRTYPAPRSRSTVIKQCDEDDSATWLCASRGGVGQKVPLLPMAAFEAPVKVDA
jgi:hypothetical protein